MMTKGIATPARASRRGSVTRFVAGFWLVVFAGATGVLPVADAMVGHATELAAHWEDGSERDCPPQHDLSECQFCQAHSSCGVRDGVGIAEIPASGKEGRQFLEAAPLGVGASQRSAPGTRGPPAA